MRATTVRSTRFRPWTMTSRQVVSLTLLLIAAFATFHVLFIQSAPQDAVHGSHGKIWRLPSKLREISGLAILDDKHVLTMTDERAAIYSFDMDTGKVELWRNIGNPAKGDFEGIARHGETVYLITSDGKLYRTPGPLQPVHVGLKKTCEIEGLDTDGDDLLILCKTNYRDRDKHKILIYAWSLNDDTLSLRMAVPVSELPGIEKLHPSALAYVKGRYVILAAREKWMVILDAGGRVLATRRIEGHRQAEGVAVMPDGRVAISDEGGHKGGEITIYNAIDDIGSPPRDRTSGGP